MFALFLYGVCTISVVCVQFCVCAFVLFPEFVYVDCTGCVRCSRCVRGFCMAFVRFPLFVYSLCMCILVRKFVCVFCALFVRFPPMFALCVYGVCTISQVVYGFLRFLHDFPRCLRCVCMACVRFSLFVYSCCIVVSTISAIVVWFTICLF